MATFTGITNASSPPALTDEIIGIGGGTTDLSYTLAQIGQALSPTPPNTQGTGITSYTLLLSDLGGIVEMTSSSPNTVTIPLNSSVPFPNGAQIDITQLGTGVTTIVAAGGVTIISSGSLPYTLPTQGSTATLYKTAAGTGATDTWVLNGAV
jgi:hypothetical protein